MTGLKQKTTVELDKIVIRDGAYWEVGRDGQSYNKERDTSNED